MRFNQFSYYSVTPQQALQELSELGFKLDLSASHKEQFESFVRTCFFNYKNTDYPLTTLAVDKETDLLTFFNSDRELTAERGTLLSTNLSVMVLFLRTITITTSMARVWQPSLQTMSFVK